MANSEQLNQAAFIYEQIIVALWDRPEALSDTHWWSACAEEAAAVAVRHYFDERLPTQEEFLQSLQWQREHDGNRTAAQSDTLQWQQSAHQAQLRGHPACAPQPQGQEPCTKQVSPGQASGLSQLGTKLMLQRIAWQSASVTDRSGTALSQGRRELLRRTAVAIMELCE